ncbi:hypothetical protein SK128_027359 [Halocaridina rubra]|uniref:Uncharacterized protein n=1 Tax=Halocaridina rubra TaxID=373956 RepID=A0AAN8X7Z7_HALRR
MLEEKEKEEAGGFEEEKAKKTKIIDERREGRTNQTARSRVLAPGKKNPTHPARRGYGGMSSCPVFIEVAQNNKHHVRRGFRQPRGVTMSLYAPLAPPLHNLDQCVLWPLLSSLEPLKILDYVDRSVSVARAAVEKGRVAETLHGEFSHCCECKTLRH